MLAVKLKRKDQWYFFRNHDSKKKSFTDFNVAMKHVKDKGYFEEADAEIEEIEETSADLTA